MVQSKRGLHSLQGKTNGACIRSREDRVLWRGLELPMVKEAKLDPLIQHGLSSRVNYVRLVRRNVHGHARYFAQLICEGFPHVKVDENDERNHPSSNEMIGVDIRPSFRHRHCWRYRGRVRLVRSSGGQESQAYGVIAKKARS